MMLRLFNRHRIGVQSWCYFVPGESVNQSPAAKTPFTGTREAATETAKTDRITGERHGSGALIVMFAGSRLPLCRGQLCDGLPAELRRSTQGHAQCVPTSSSDFSSYIYRCSASMRAI